MSAGFVVCAGCQNAVTVQDERRMLNKNHDRSFTSMSVTGTLLLYQFTGVFCLGVWL